MTFGERLIALREDNGYLKRNAFAKKLGIPETTLRNYEKNEREPGHTFLKQISDVFNVSVDYLLGLTDEKEKQAEHNLKSSEWEHIQKYRALDDHGRDHVNIVLDWETQRVQALAQKDDSIADLQQQLTAQPSQLLSVEEAVHPYYIAYYQRMASAGNGEYLFDDIPSDLIAVPDTPMARQADFVLGVIGDSMEPTFYDGDKVFVEKTDIVQTGEIGIFFIGRQCYIKEAGADGLISHNPNYVMIPGSDEIRCAGKVLGKVE